MKLFTTKQIAQIDAYTIEHEPIASIDLMERAATEIAKWIVSHVPKDRRLIFIIGPGNNGGDGLAVARLLEPEKYKSEVYFIKLGGSTSADCTANLKRLKELKSIKVKDVSDVDDLPSISPDDVVIDAMFGTGLSSPLQGLAAETVIHINQSGAVTIAIDMPSGLFGEDNSDNIREHIIRADYTLTFQFPKVSFMFGENEIFTGRWEKLEIGLHPEAINDEPSNYIYLTKDYILPLLRKRTRFAHKGHFGHALLIAGSYGKMGAAVLGAKACMKTGAGLLTVQIPQLGYNILQTSIPEAMANVDSYEKIISKIPEQMVFNAVAMGPGTGKSKVTQNAFKDLLDKNNAPMVLDADAINILGENPEWLMNLPANTILTPHPKEFARLTGEIPGSYNRHIAQLEFAIKHNLIVILKGANTSIAFPNGNMYFNSTGNPGMATAGSGDVLTGVILSLLAQNYPPEEAALIGVYLHGLAGDFATEELGEESVIANDIIDNISKALKSLKAQI